MLSVIVEEDLIGSPNGAIRPVHGFRNSALPVFLEDVQIAAALAG